MSQTKTVYQFDQRTRVFTGVMILDQSDILPGTDGEFQIPAGCTEVPVPDLKVGQFAVLDKDESWQVHTQNGPALETLPDTSSSDAKQASKILERIVSEWLEGIANQLGYTSMDRAISYAEELSVAKYCAEGRALRKFRSAVWVAFYEAISPALDGQEEVPSVHAIFTALPKWSDTWIEEASKALEGAITTEDKA